MWLSRLLVVLSVFALCAPAEAQQPAKLPRFTAPLTAASDWHIVERAGSPNWTGE